MLETAATAVLSVAAIYLVILGAACLLAPERASRFLLGFASSRSKHYAEMLIRIVIGCALLILSERIHESRILAAIGWILVVTSIVLLLLPWRHHQKFAGRAVPLAIKHIRLIGLASLALGAAVLGAVLSGWFAQELSAPG